MNISELKLIAFGQHIDIKIKFTPGLNVIVGESETGKTTLIRALYLIIENQPRGGEKLYQSWLTDKKLMIQIKDDAGNTVKRTNNKYYINDNNPLKAFGAIVPKPVRELFNFKEINWQKQHDVHYLLFSTGGTAARLLNSATGMSDQETIIDAFKQKLSNAKSEIKRFKKNNVEHLQTVERLKNIVRYRLKAEGIIYLEKESNELEIKVNRLENILIQLELIKEAKVKYEASKSYNIIIENIIHEIKEVNEFNNYISKLNITLKNIKEIKIVNPNIISNLSNSLQVIHSKNLKLSELKTKTESLKGYINKIEASKLIQETTRKSILIQQKEIDQTFKDLGYCPLCNRVIEGDHEC